MINVFLFFLLTMFKIILLFFLFDKFCIADYDQLNLIHEAIKEYEKYTCIQLRPRTDEEDYVKFVSYNTGCWSYVGKIGGEQSINLQIPGCVTKKGTVIHEIMHAIGFWHEHTRDDRDDYVTINWDNIEECAYIRNLTITDLK